MALRKIIVSVATIGLPLGAASALAAAGPASASAAAGAGTGGTGTYHCSKVTGTITFVPPLTSAGGRPETSTIKTTATGCTGGSPTPTKVTGTSTVTSSSNACSTLLASRTVVFKLAYTPTSAGKSTLTGVFAPVASPPGFTLSNGTVTGAYPSTTASAQANLSLNLGLCNTTGLKSAKITSGSLTGF